VEAKYVKEILVTRIAVIAYKYIKAALAERRMGEERILKRLREVESRIHNVEWQSDTLSKPQNDLLVNAENKNRVN
jgi:hypothetical protein